jgi:3-oxoacyl-[acyl-carrier protein] reductase
MTGLTLTGLEGKVAVVTGAGRMRSIGRPIAVELARAGCDVVLTGTGRAPERYPDDEKQAGWRDIDSVAGEVQALGRRALPVISDVSDPGAVDRLLAEVLGTFGRVDIIVNNAAAARGADRVPVIDLDIDLWRTVIDVNLNGTFYVGHAFGRAIAEQGNGSSILNSSSDAGKMMSARTAAYSASKPVSTPSPARWHLSSVGPACGSTRSVPASSIPIASMTSRAVSNGTTSWRACRWDAPAPARTSPG